MKRTVLVTGAGGKTGRRLVPQLLRCGMAVRATTRSGLPGVAAAPGLQHVQFDWTDPDTYPRAVAGVDAIYLVAGDVTGDDLDEPAMQVSRLLAEADRSRVRRVVLLSALGVEQAPPDDPLRRVEVAVASCGLPAVMVRPGAFMQNFSEPHWSRLDVGIRERDLVELPGGDSGVSWVSTEDIAAVATAALTEDGHEGKAYTVTGGEALTMPDVVDHLRTVTGRPIRHLDADENAVQTMVAASGAAPVFAAYMAHLFVFALTTGAFGLVTDDVTTVTGRQPITFAEYAAGAAGVWR
jgi:uncharacterized protein YbjT (DUF2867 family)